MRFGASSRHIRHNAQLVSTYHCPGAFSGCLLSLSAMLRNKRMASDKVSSDLLLRVTMAFCASDKSQQSSHCRTAAFATWKGSTAIRRLAISYAQGADVQLKMSTLAKVDGQSC